MPLYVKLFNEKKSEFEEEQLHIRSSTNEMIPAPVLLELVQAHVERGSSVVECRTRNQVNPGSNRLFATVSKIGHFRSLHWRPSWLSCLNECLAIDSGGNVSDLVFTRNRSIARMLPGEAELVSEWTGLPRDE